MSEQQYFATIDSNGVATGFYAGGAQPTGAVGPLSPDVYLDWIVNQPARAWSRADNALGVVSPTLSQLQAYADAKLSAYWAGSIIVNVGSNEEPVNVSVDVGSKGQTFVAGLMLSVALGSTSETWFQAGGSITITGQQVQAIGQALKAYVDARMAVWQQAERGIAASPPTITSRAQIDALPWPALATA